MSKAEYKNGIKFLAVALVCLLCYSSWTVWNSSEFSHPAQKIKLERSCKTHISKKLKKMYSAYAIQSNTEVKPSYYKNTYNPDYNIFTMRLGPKADKIVRKANNSNQTAQDEVTQVTLSQNAMAQQFKRANKKTGLQILDSHGKMLYFAQDGKMKYNIMPTVKQIN